VRHFVPRFWLADAIFEFSRKQLDHENSARSGPPHRIFILRVQRGTKNAARGFAAPIRATIPTRY
jgi:hypothetical protein